MKIKISYRSLAKDGSFLLLPTILFSWYDDFEICFAWLISSVFISFSKEKNGEELP